MNLLQETLSCLSENGKSEEDILYLGGSDFEITWENFKKVADEDYNNGYGAQKVVDDLVICGKDWWMKRGEYDGSEWWEFMEKPKRPSEVRLVKEVIGGMWASLSEINKD